MISWTGHVDDKSYQDALRYLSLTCGENTAHVLVNKLRNAPITMESPGDLLRAAHREGATNDAKMARLRQMEAKGVRFQPVLFVHTHLKSDIADGFHRVSYAATKAVDTIPVKKVELP